MKKMSGIESEITLKNYERELELCQKSGGDVERYRRLSFNVFQLEQIRLGLEHGLDVESYTDPKLTWVEMECARELQESGLDMSAYMDKGFTLLQCGEILAGKKDGVDVSIYADRRFLGDQMRQIRRGLEEGLDVSVYADPSYDGGQMREIRKGLADGLDVSVYASHEFRAAVMRALRKALLLGEDLSEYGRAGYGAKELLELARGKKDGNPDILLYFERGFHAEQLEKINDAYEAGVTISPYVSINLYGTQLGEILKGLKKDLDVSVYAKESYNWFQMREIRFGLENKIDVSAYADPAFTYRQMEQIRKALQLGLDVTDIAKVYYEPEQMEELCEKMQKEQSEEEASELKMLEEKFGLSGKDVLTPDVSEESEEGGENAESLGFSEVTVSEDKMQATINLPPKENGEHYTIFEVTKMLRGSGVKQGIDNERLKKVIENDEFDQDIVVARGKPVVNGKDGFYQYYFNKALKKSPKVLENGAVDYKNMNLFETVEKDQLLAEYIPPQKGEFGYNVLGEFLHPQKGQELPPLFGEGFFVSEDHRKYYSLLDGIVELENNEKLSVRSLLVITGDVDVSTGNIVFEGDVNITGTVRAGFSVSAKGNVSVDGRCESCTIRAGKDILIRRGCQGNGTGRIQAGGSVIGHFFESVTVRAGGDMEASYLLNTDVAVNGMLKVEGRRGVIIGGKVAAKMGIDCHGVGTVAEVKTILQVGIDTADMTHYQDLSKQLLKVQTEIKTLEAGVVKLMGIRDKDEETLNFFNRLTKALYNQKAERKKLEQEKKDMAERMTKQKTARIVVGGIVYPGTKIYINTEPYVVQQECHNIQFVKWGNTIKAD